MADGVRRPNILLITCDQWRADCLSAVGHPLVRTPNIDALGRQGVLFTHHFAGAAPCAPARACLYTGLYQMNNRVCRNGSPLDSRHDNIARAARRGGYEPVLFGYTDVGPDPKAHAPDDPVLRSYEGVLPGFSVRQLLPEHQKPWLSWLAARGHDVSMGSPDIHRPAGAGHDEVTDAPPAYSADETETAFMTGEFLRWLSEQEAAAPWFAHVSFIRPHPPFAVPAPYNRLFDPGDAPGFARASDLDAEAAIHPWVAWELGRQKKRKFLPAAKGRVADWSDAEMRRIAALYYGMIAEVDSQLGRIWRGLADAGQWENTVIVFTSDHAEHMGDHHMLGKGGFFDGSYRIPLIIRDPRRAATFGATIDRFTEAVDLMPTLLDIAGLPGAPETLDGRSLKPFLDGEGPARWRDAAHWEFDFRSIATAKAERHFGIASHRCNLTVVRTASTKYVHFGGGLPPVLFDLETDPHETVNLAGDPDWSATRLMMAERLLDWRAAHLDRSLSLCELTEEGVVGPFAAAHP